MNNRDRFLHTNTQQNFPTLKGMGNDANQTNIQKMISAVAMDRVNSNIVTQMHNYSGFAAGTRHHQSQATGIGNIIKRDP